MAFGDPNKTAAEVSQGADHAEMALLSADVICFKVFRHGVGGLIPSRCEGLRAQWLKHAVQDLLDRVIRGALTRSRAAELQDPTMAFDVADLGWRTLGPLTVADAGLVGLANAGPATRAEASLAPRNMMHIICDIPMAGRGGWFGSECRPEC